MQLAIGDDSDDAWLGSIPCRGNLGLHAGMQSRAKHGSVGLSSAGHDRGELTRSSTLGSLPLAMTVVTPDWAASHADATLASMPPRPTLLPVENLKLSRILGMNVWMTLRHALPFSQ